MSSSEFEFARESLAEIDQALAEHCLQVFEHMQSPLGRLAIDKRLLEEAQRDGNAALLANFVGELPHARATWDNNWKFTTRDPNEVRRLQSSVIWAESTWGYDGKSKPKYPYYLLGSRTNEHRGWTDALLHAAFEKRAPGQKFSMAPWLQSSPLVVISVRDEGWAEAQRAQRELEEKEFEDNPELDEIFDERSGLFTLTQNSTNVIRTHPVFFPGSLLQRRGNFTKDGKLRSSRIRETGLNNDEVRQFNTITQLALLALSYGKVSELDLLFQMRLDQEMPSPIDHMLDNTIHAEE